MPSWMVVSASSHVTTPICGAAAPRTVAPVPSGTRHPRACRVLQPLSELQHKGRIKHAQSTQVHVLLTVAPRKIVKSAPKRPRPPGTPLAHLSVRPFDRSLQPLRQPRQKSKLAKAHHAAERRHHCEPHRCQPKLHASPAKTLTRAKIMRRNCKHGLR